MKKFLILIIPLFLSAKFMDVSKLPDPLFRPDTKNITIADAKLSLGYPKEAISNPDLFINAQTPIVIIDSGFYGLKEFLKKNPQYKKNIKRWYMFNDNGMQSKGTHGFKVYKTALSDTPKAYFHLYEIDLSHSAKNLEKVFKQMQKDQLYLANMSFGSTSFFGEDSRAINSKLLKLLKKYQITVFKSMGNYRDGAHYFKYNDKNKNGIIEFIDLKSFHKDHEINVIKGLKNRQIDIRLRWQYSFNGDISGKVELQLINTKGKIVASTQKDKTRTLSLKYTPKQKELLAIQVIDKGIKNPQEKYFSLYVEHAIFNTKRSYFNGFGISGYKTLVESPFIITVGSFGQGKDNKLLPSYFSSYSKTIDGQILPHILGPGQLLVNKKEMNGTSYASPFITAFASRAADYNIKNFIESLSSKNNLDPSLKEIEKSRWGVPDMHKWNYTNYCLSSNKMENLKGDIKDNKLLITFDFSRNCMEGLDYRLFLKLKAFKKGESKVSKYLEFPSQVYKSKEKNIQKQKVTVEMPLKKLPIKYERLALSELKIQTRALKNSTKTVMSLRKWNKGFKNPNLNNTIKKEKQTSNNVQEKTKGLKETMLQAKSDYKPIKRVKDDENKIQTSVIITTKFGKIIQIYLNVVSTKDEDEIKSAVIESKVFENSNLTKSGLKQALEKELLQKGIAQKIEVEKIRGQISG